MLLRIVLVIIIILFSAYSVFATDINVATPVTATTINTAIASASPGDNVIIPNGSYGSLGQIQIPSNIDGTETNPITLKGATAGGVTFTGDSASPLIFVQGDWWVIRDFKFIDVSEVGAVITYGIRTSDATNTRVTNNYFEGFGVLSSSMNRAIWIGLYGGGEYSRVDHNTFIENETIHITIYYTATHCQIDHNYFKNSLKDGVENNGFEGIQTGPGGSYEDVDLYTTVEYNLFENMAADEETISNKSSSNTYQYNVFKSTESATAHGIVLRGGDDCIVEGNYFFDIDRRNIRVHGAGHKIINNYFENPGYSAILLAEGGTNYANVSDIFIAANTIINPGLRGIYIGWWPNCDVKPNNLTFKNNIIKSSTGNLVRDSGHTGTFIWITNLHYATGAASYWYNDGGGGEPGSGITHGDPDLTQGTYIQRLQAASSNAIESGTVDGAVTDDIDDDARDGSTPDIGCDEYSVSDPTRLPMQEYDVGVSWLRLRIYDATPTGGSLGISVTTDLNWTNPESANNIDLLFDKKSEHDPPTTVKENDQNVETWDCGTLNYSTEYAWRVDVNHAGGTETGIVYYFTTTTESNPPTPSVGMNYCPSGVIGNYHSSGVKIR